MNGAELIAAERRRQVEVKGWTAEHDVRHGWRGSGRAAPLVQAAMAYLDRDVTRWPWAREFWKPAPSSSPADRARELVKAGALIAAEIDRLRASATEEGGGNAG